MAHVGAAMVLCAGLGTRLRPLTEWLAKPLVPVGDRPAVAHVTRLLRDALPDLRIVVNVHHRPDDVRSWAAGERIDVSEEAQLLGTAGGVARAAPLLGAGDVLVWNGDILSDLSPRALVAAHRGEATLAVLPRPAGEGNVGLDAEGRLVRLRAERFGDEVRGGEFLGVHVLGARLRAALPATGCLVGDAYLPALRRGEALYAHEVDAAFVDVGTIGKYLEANRDWLAARGLRAWADPSATVRAPIEGSVVGAGARVEAPCSRAVVWPGARVDAPVTDAVVTPQGVVGT